MRPLFRWPLRDRRANVVTYTFRLTVVAGEPTTPVQRRTYAFDVVFDRSMNRGRIKQAVALRAKEIGGDMAGVMLHEVMRAIENELGEKPPAEPEGA